MMNEQESNVAQDTPETEELEIKVEDQIAETDVAVNSDDELENYTKGVSKRINKLNERNRLSEERANKYQQLAAQREQENKLLKEESLKNQTALIEKEEESLKVKEVQADELYKKAVASGDAELMSKADTLKSDLSIQKEKIRLANQHGS